MKALGLLLLLALSACMAIPTPGARRAHAETLARQHGWEAETFPSGQFDLLVYRPAELTSADVLSIYIEGDGFAWITESQPSADPTPRDPLALRLALAQPDRNAVYLARPCQYVDAEATGCPGSYWTEKRFSPEVITAIDRAIDLLKQRFRTRQLILVGYSGGGAVATLLAARRKDVRRLVTVAGNLDHRSWTTYHRSRPLAGSLDPADYSAALEGVVQWHFVGGNDKVIPPLLAEKFAGRFPEGSKPMVQIFREFDHHCCWIGIWPTLWRRSQASE